MISLKIKDYCHNCDEFEAEVEKLDRGLTFHDTIITCAHECRCQQIKNYLEENKESHIKSENLCKSCRWYCENCCLNCHKCDMHTFDAGGVWYCKCGKVSFGEPCPYYKQNT